MPRTLVTMVALALLAAAAAPAAEAQAATAKPTCKRAHSRTVAGNGLVRVFTRPGSDGSNDGTDLLACWKRSGRVRGLAFAFDDNYVTSARFDLVRARGRFVAFYAESTDISCKAACPPDYEPTRRRLNVLDVRSGRGYRVALAEPPAAERLLLSADGAIAWPRWLAANQIEVRVVDGAGERAVDGGAIHPESLSLTRGGLLGWVKDGVAHSLTLERSRA